MPKWKQATGHITKTFLETLRSQEAFVGYLLIKKKKKIHIKHFIRLRIKKIGSSHT